MCARLCLHDCIGACKHICVRSRSIESVHLPRLASPALGTRQRQAGSGMIEMLPPHALSLEVWKSQCFLPSLRKPCHTVFPVCLVGQHDPSTEPQFRKWVSSLAGSRWHALANDACAVVHGATWSPLNTHTSSSLTSMHFHTFLCYNLQPQNDPLQALHHRQERWASGRLWDAEHKCEPFECAKKASSLQPL